MLPTGQVFVYNNAGAECRSSTLIDLNTWYHIAVVRENGTAKLYINGVHEGTANSFSTPSNSLNVVIGSMYSAEGDNHNWGLNGYIDEIRISKGIARWTSNFTPPDQPYQ